MKRRVMAFLTVIMLVLAFASPQLSIRAEAASQIKSLKSVKVGTKLTVGKLKYKVTKLSRKGGEAAVTGIKKKAAGIERQPLCLFNSYRCGGRTSCPPQARCRGG